MEQVEMGIVLECPEHGFGVPRVADTGLHLKATCPTCGRYLKFVPRKAEWLALSKARS